MIATDQEGDGHGASRPVMILIGLLAGLWFWVLTELILHWVPEKRTFLFLTTASLGFFAVLLALAGPARILPALPLAAGIAATAAGLVWLGSWRHDDIGDYLSLGYPVAAYGLILLIATPFAAAALRSPAGWRDYPTLFELSWRILMRYASAGIFVGLFWALVLFSDLLLRLVEVRLEALIMYFDVVPWMLSGAVFGLALAVTHELRDYLSPYLLLRLLRLFLPVVLAVVAVFLLALPVRGMSNLVGTLSAAGTLMGMALAGIVLITVTLDRDRFEEVGLGWLRRATQVLALLIPLLGALALYALWVRVAQYGWTPPRLMAAFTGGVLALYGLGYALAILRRTVWTARIRQTNVAMALLILVLSALWLSPALVPERIAAQDHVARFQSGQLPAEDLALREMAQDWGHAGARALALLEDDPALTTAIAAARANRVWPGRQEGDALRADLVAALPVQGGTLTAAALKEVPEPLLSEWQAACARAVTGGPGCALVLGAFVPQEEALRGILFLNDGYGWVSQQAIQMKDGMLRAKGRVVNSKEQFSSSLPITALEALHRGESKVAPARLKTLQIGEIELFPEN